MPTFISLVNFTDQGIRGVKDSPNRAETFMAAANRMGLQVKGMWWTQGSYDMVVVTEGSDEAGMAALLATAMQGNVRSQTLRAYSAGEFKKILSMLP